ncbi:MAG: type III pantothenate kinase [Prevotella sp.]
MHILIDIGNSTVVVAIATSDGNISDTWRFKTLKGETSTFFRSELQAGFSKYGVTPSCVSSVTVSSVVPEVNDDISQAVTDLTGLIPHFFSVTDALSVFSIDIESPSLAGHDRLADAIGAACCYGTPALVFDMGTATTVGVVSADNVFLGGMIIPGVKTSLAALSSRASQLPSINIDTPRDIIGRNTLECMQSGILYGTASMVDGIIDLLASRFPSPPVIVATGGMARKIIPHCRHTVIIDDFLQFKGLFYSVVKKK